MITPWLRRIISWTVHPILETPCRKIFDTRIFSGKKGNNGYKKRHFRKKCTKQKCKTIYGIFKTSCYVAKLNFWHNSGNFRHKENRWAAKGSIEGWWQFGKFFSTFWVGCMVRFETLTFEISSFLSWQSDWPTLLGTLKSIWKSICRSLCGDAKSTCREFYVCCILFSFSFVSSFVTISALQAS